MNAEIISVGTEILLGDIANTDARDISVMLAEVGINVFYHTAVGDNESRLRDVISIAQARSDIIITTGGLGPTYDDLTKEVISSSFGKKLVLNDRCFEIIKGHFKGRKMSDNNIKQAYIPEDAVVFENRWGTAPGCAFYVDGKHILMLPGPPKECIPMFREEALRYLQGLSNSIIVSRKVKIFGIGESEVDEKLRTLISEGDNPTIAPYVGLGECFLRVTARGRDEEECKLLLEPVLEHIKIILGSDVYGIDTDSIESAVIHELSKRGITISTAESCTGGLLSKKLTDISGASKCFVGGVCAYSNDVKMDVLGVSRETLDKYGAVSEKTAREMAIGITRLMKSDIGVGITGIAGDRKDNTDIEVGLVYICVYYDNTLYEHTLNYNAGRHSVRNRAAMQALDIIRRDILKI